MHARAPVCTQYAVASSGALKLYRKDADAAVDDLKNGMTLTNGCETSPEATNSVFCLELRPY